MIRGDRRPKTGWLGWLLRCWLVAGVGLMLSLAAAWVQAGDWPQWRYDAARGAATPETLPDELHLQWTRELPAPRPAWPPSQPWLRFDVSYSPVAAGGLLFVPSMVDDTVTAYELASGRQRWRFFAGGPVRLAPVADAGKVYFGSDDGFLYCLDGATGSFCWRVRGGPYERRVLGNERMISTWPVRTGPVLRDGVIYFTAGIWPFMGIFVRAVDASTGQVLWTNSGEGDRWQVQPHNSPAFGGFVPRGYLAATPDTLVAAGGRTQPGCYDRKTGVLRFFEFGAKNSGTWQVSARGQWYFNGQQMLRTADGKAVLDTPASVHDEQAVYTAERGQLVARQLEPEFPNGKAEMPAEVQDRLKAALQTVAERITGEKQTAEKKPASKATQRELWRAELPVETPPQLALKAGARFVLAGDGAAAVVEVRPGAARAKLVARAAFDGRPWSLLVADQRLVVVTEAGRIFCYGEPPGTPATHTLPPSDTPTDELAKHFVDELAASPSDASGYALWLGASSPQRMVALAQATQLKIVVVEPDVQRVATARRALWDRGLYGSRMAVLEGSVSELALPPFFASLAVVECLPAEQRQEVVEAVYHCLRPYGGAAVFCGLPSVELARLVEASRLEKAQVADSTSSSRLQREGPLPGAGQWTHQYGDAANSGVSADRLVRAPLGVLWWGGPSHDDVLPRHGHGPAPQVAGGRLFIEGPDMLRAIDVYTGRLLWQKSFPLLGKFYDNTSHQPGAGEIGSNYACTAEHVYVAQADRVLSLRATDGGQAGEFRIPAESGSSPVFAGFVAVDDGLLVTTASPQRYVSSSPQLLVFDCKQGTLLWQRRAAYGFRHNAICLAAGRVYCIDSLSQLALDQAKRRGEEPQKQPAYQPQLLALDACTGRELWSTRQNVFGTFLNYSQEHGVLLQAGSAARDRAKDEATAGMVAYRGSDGNVLWQDLSRKYQGPCLLHHGTILTQGEAYSLFDGQRHLRRDPLTGEQVPWKFTRNYGCNTVIASEHLLTFRSAAAGFYDLTCDGGTGNWGGFKSGCTSNLIVADGVLAAPEYTRTCTCRYQNQTSLALVHDPAAEMWTFQGQSWSGSRVLRAGVNFGAPGDRRDDAGTLWMEWPSIGGISPDLPVQVKPDKPAVFRQHSGLVRQLAGPAVPAWVAASGIKDVERLVLTLSKKADEPLRPYRVRLVFLDPDAMAAGQRVFTVRLQDGPESTPIDIVREAGPLSVLAKEFPAVLVGNQLAVTFTPQKDSTLGAVCSGIEVVAEGAP